MCDYSIRHVASRPAKVGDKLVTTNFDKPENRGFAAVGEPNVAVCLLPGTELSLERPVEYDHVFGRLFPSLRSRKSRGHKVARFRQVNMNAVGVHHDALEFPNGKAVLVASLLPGQHATVLQLPAMPSNASQVERPETERANDPATPFPAPPSRVRVTAEKHS
jgi:hypothetical protein